MERLLEIVFALLCLGMLHFGFQYLSRKAAKGVGRGAGAVIRPGLQRILTRYYRRRVIRRMQEERKQQGIPPLENPGLD